MQPWPTTCDTLLARLHDPSDQQAWEQFASIYEPIICNVARRRGLQDADARDVAQRVLWTVARFAEQWVDGNTSGKFRGWLSKVTTNAALNILQRDQKHRASANSDAWQLLQEHPDSNQLSQVWGHERRMELFRYAAKQVRCRFSTENWDCFWRTTVGNEEIAVVANEFGKSIGAIYMSRSRIMASIRQLVAEIESEETAEISDCDWRPVALAEGDSIDES